MPKDSDKVLPYTDEIEIHDGFDDSTEIIIIIDHIFPFESVPV
jgi:hypothetical protein